MQYAGCWPIGGVIEILTSDSTCSSRASASFAVIDRQSGSWATAMGTGARATRSASARRRARNSSGEASSGGSNNVARLDIGDPGGEGEYYASSHKAQLHKAQGTTIPNFTTSNSQLGRWRLGRWGLLNVVPCY